MKKILLINPNRMKPPVAPIAIDYIGSALEAAGFSLAFLDLSFEDDADAALQRLLSDDVLYVGITVRNVDDSFFATRDFCLARIQPLVRRIRELTDAPVVLGGVGYSIFPVAALEYLGADYGVQGDGEEAAVALARAFLERNPPCEIRGLVWREGGSVRRNEPSAVNLDALGLTRRDIVDNPRYLREGAMVGFETKRGCTAACSFCADPLAKGTTCRLRPPAHVAQELSLLAERGVAHFHTCDSEFNIPRSHAVEVCRAMIRAGLGEKIRWYAYMNPAYFDKELASLMKRSGCAGINFGADHSEESLLKKLGRVHTAELIMNAARLCRAEDIACMFDLLFGAPGETRATVKKAIDFLKATPASCIGASIGLRLYRGTSLSEELLASATRDSAGFHGDSETDRDLLRPAYYLSPLLGEDPYGLLQELVGDDERFFVASPARNQGDYNYNDNSTLSEAIRRGERGAFWDILRRNRKKR